MIAIHLVGVHRIIDMNIYIYIYLLPLLGLFLCQLLQINHSPFTPYTPHDPYAKAKTNGLTSKFKSRVLTIFSPIYLCDILWKLNDFMFFQLKRKGFQVCRLV